MRLERFLVLLSALAYGVTAAGQAPSGSQEDNSASSQASRLHDHAEETLRKALQAASESGNPDQLVAALDNLADFLGVRRNYTEAEQLYLRAVTVGESTHGLDSREPAVQLTKIASLFQEQARYSEAEERLQQALRINTKNVGEQHSSTGTIVNNLAGVYNSMGKYPEAEALYRRALQIWENTVGPEHSFVAVALENLATVEKEEAKFLDAEPLLSRAL